MKETTNSGISGEEHGHEHRTVLTDDRRRFVTTDLLARVRPVAIHDLTDRLLTWERERGNDPGQFHEVRTELAEDHLPRLVDAGLVEAVGDDRYTLSEDGMAVEAAARDIDVDAVSGDAGSASTD